MGEEAVVIIEAYCMVVARNQDRTTVAPRILFEAPGQLSEVDPDSIAANETYDGALVSGGDLSDRDLAGTTFTECELAGLTLTEAQFRGARFVDTLVSASFAPVLLAARSSWRRCRIETPRWGSAELFEANWNDVHILGGKIDFLNLRTSTLVNVLIENCTITELDLGGAQLDRVAFVNCRIDTLEAANARCNSVDLRTSEFARINGFDGLRGATIDDLQLSLFSSALADHVGIRVE
jgi:uncharacterized protein YjbI with pentapeptide repeats